MTNQELVEVYKDLSDLQKNTKLIFSAKVAYAIMRNIKTLTPFVEDIQTAEQQIYLRYGEEAKDKPGVYQVKPEHVSTVMEELNDLQKVENDIKFAMISIKDISKLELSVQDMSALYPMIKDEEEE